MIHEVEFHGMIGGADQVRIGVIRYDDEADEFTTEPANDSVLTHVLDTPIRLAQNVKLDAKTSPERFMAALHRQYRGYGLQASECTSLPAGITDNSYQTYDIPFAEDVR